LDNSKLVPWHRQRDSFDEIILKSGTDHHVRKFKNKYLPYAIDDEIKRDTIFWYEPDREGKTMMAGIFLKDVIPPAIQKHTFYSFHQMKWREPRRKETIPAIKLQEKQGSGPSAGEWLVGFSSGVVQWGTVHTKQAIYIRHLELIRMADTVFKKVLPEYHQLQNIPMDIRARELEATEKRGQHPKLGGIPARYRLFLSSFSALAILRNCPTACHKDRNARPDETNFSCLTSVGDYKGGGFCLPEYKLRVPVKPGDLLIFQTSKEWHTNIGAIKGEKYSIVFYYQTRLANPHIAIGTGVPEETEGDRTLDGFLARTRRYKQSRVTLSNNYHEIEAGDKLGESRAEVARRHREELAQLPAEVREQYEREMEEIKAEQAKNK
jgi:hypothetical protein